jgi:hypothetical protein
MDALWFLGLMLGFLVLTSHVNSLRMIYTQAERLVELRLSLSYVRIVMLLEWAGAYGLLSLGDTDYSMTALDLNNLSVVPDVWVLYGLTSFSAIYRATECAEAQYLERRRLLSILRVPLMPEIFCHFDATISWAFPMFTSKLTIGRAVSTVLWD